MRQVAAIADPDGPSRVVTLPVSWDDNAANALCALVPGDGPIHLPMAAQSWIGKIAAENTALESAWHHALLRRQATASRSIWAGNSENPGFVVNAAAFFCSDAGFDCGGFAEVAQLCARAARELVAPGPNTQYRIGLSGIDDLLALIGLEYASDAARKTIACLSALFRANVDYGLDGAQLDLLAAPAAWPQAPEHCAIPGLAKAALLAHRNLLRAPDAPTGAGVFPCSASDALLGIETAGIAPAFAPAYLSVNHRAQLTNAARARLAASGMGAESALAATILGQNLFEHADLRAHQHMHSAVAPYLSVMPPMPQALPAPAGAPAIGLTLRARGKLPSRHISTMRKATLAGHRIFLRTGEYEDGALGEITLTLPSATANLRGMAEIFAQTLSIALQHGVLLEEFVESLSETRFGQGGRVEGDEQVSHAASIIDYVMRSLSAQYLGRQLPPPKFDPHEDMPVEDTGPLLPLDLPRDESARNRRRAFRLVA